MSEAHKHDLFSSKKCMKRIFVKVKPNQKRIFSAFKTLKQNFFSKFKHANMLKVKHTNIKLVIQANKSETHKQSFHRFF